MSYKIKQTKEFQEDAIKLLKNEPSAYKKLKKLVDELIEHPRSGTGRPEQLKYYGNETWSRQVTRKHRLIYEIQDEMVIVMLLSAYGHYDDK